MLKNAVVLLLGMAFVLGLSIPAMAQLDEPGKLAEACGVHMQKIEQELHGLKMRTLEAKLLAKKLRAFHRKLTRDSIMLRNGLEHARLSGLAISLQSASLALKADPFTSWTKDADYPELEKALGGLSRYLIQKSRFITSQSPGKPLADQWIRGALIDLEPRLKELRHMAALIDRRAREIAEKQSNLEERRADLTRNCMNIAKKLAQKHEAAMPPEERASQTKEAERAYKQGLDAIRNKKYDQAIPLLTKALDTGLLAQAQKARAYFQRGYSHGRFNRMKQALADVQEAVRLAPDNSIYHHSLGWLHMRLGDYAKALAECRAALDLNPKGAFIYLTMSRIHELTGDCQKALKYAHKAVSLKRDNQGLRTNLARLNKKGCKDVSPQGISSGAADGAAQYLGTWVRMEAGRVVDVITIKRSGDQFNAELRKDLTRQVHSLATGQVAGKDLRLKAQNLLNLKESLLTIQVSGGNMLLISTGLDGSNRLTTSYVKR